ncbi:MAG: substrate-binding domain-containing protein [Desulfuromonadaceae bacterium]|nr:substrate-binding domain-containing protein [Desulfuromonadaceae bacterium]MDD5105140.1 substrate-binding domain-containing protein [Desulfuromonadaceae bacterium]
MVLKRKNGLKILFIALLLVCIPVLAARAETILKVGGTGSALGTMRQLATLYEKSHPGIKIMVMPSLGSTGAIKAILMSKIDLALSGRALNDAELQKGAQEAEYARSPLVVATNSKISKMNVTTRELAEFYSNPAARWPDGSRVRLVLRPEHDIDTILMRSLSPEIDHAMKAALSRPGLIMAITDQEAAEMIVKTPGALGFVALSEIMSENRTVNQLSLNDVHARSGNTPNPSYPVLRSFYLVTTPKTSSETLKFVDFIQSSAAAAVLAKNGNMVVKR